MDTRQATFLDEIRTSFPPDWQVPDFRIDFWDGTTSQCCVVVPVINEGDRIRQFVQRLNAHKIHAYADIIIVDGGSTDGSLDHGFLQCHGVRGLLTKTSIGRLSAQLRVAYAFALILGYQTVITIDGNNKDDPSVIPDFAAAIASGYDFVQASRFVRGGRSRNTPLSRYLAIRLIHAPLLSLASGFYWTDTTQGFRAYSERLLNSAKIKPFRSIFVDYELLAYLSARAPRVGFRCVELPATREYPRGLVPTKISLLKGNLALIKTLLKASIGYYNPK